MWSDKGLSGTGGEAVPQPAVDTPTPSSMSPTPPPAYDMDLEKLGRQRPEVFKNTWVEVGFCVAILGSMLTCEYLVSGFNVLLPILITDLDIDPSNRTWPSSIFSLVSGAFLLPFGRLADRHGGWIIYIVGLAWMLIWTLVGGFAHSYALLLATRAFQGLGAAAVLPAGLSLLGNMYRPGPRKNIVFSLYGACAPTGFFSGIFFAGVSGQFLTWGWYFWIDAIFLLVVSLVSVFSVPRDKPTFTGDMDWWGWATSIPALTLVTYAITDSTHVEGGWKSPQILAPFVVGLAFLGAFVYVEGWVAKSPLLPPSLFAPKYTKPLFVCLFFSYGCFGIYMFYAAFYIETILHIGPLLAAAWFTPLAVGGILIGVVGGQVLHKLTGTILLLFSTCAFIVCNVLFAVIPNDPNYWAWIFPAMICTTLGIDIMYNTSTIFITTSIPKEAQGVAGAFISVLPFFGMSFFLGWADLAVGSNSGLGLESSFKIAFFLAVGLGGVSLMLVVFMIRVPKAKSDLTFEEKAEQIASSEILPK